MADSLPTLFGEVASAERRARAESGRQLSLLLERASGDIGRLIGESVRISHRLDAICAALASELEAPEQDAAHAQRLLFIVGRLACDSVDSEARATRYALRGKKLAPLLVGCLAKAAAPRTRYLAASALQEMCGDTSLAADAVDAGAVVALQHVVRLNAAAAAGAKRGDDVEMTYRFAAGALNAILRIQPSEAAPDMRPSSSEVAGASLTLAEGGPLDQHSSGVAKLPSRPSEASLPSISSSRRSSPHSTSISRPMSASISLPSLPLASLPALPPGKPTDNAGAAGASSNEATGSSNQAGSGLNKRSDARPAPASRPPANTPSSRPPSGPPRPPSVASSIHSGVHSDNLSRLPSRKPSANVAKKRGELSYDEVREPRVDSNPPGVYLHVYMHVCTYIRTCIYTPGGIYTCIYMYIYRYRVYPMLTTDICLSDGMGADTNPNPPGVYIHVYIYMYIYIRIGCTPC